MKRIVSLILICCLAMVLSVGAYAVDDTTSYTGGLALGETTVEQGKTVDVTMSLPSEKLATVQFGISFDKEYLEVTAIDAPGAEDVTGFGLYAASEIAAANENGLLTFAYVGAKGENVLQFGEEVITVTFKALKAGETTVSVADEVKLIMEDLKLDGYNPDNQYEPDEAYKSVKLTITEPEYILGDVNGDGKIGMPDALMVARAAQRYITLTDTQKFAADVNGDGKVGMPDALMIARYAQRYITSF